MYTRNYSNRESEGEEELRIPENYGGSAFAEAAEETFAEARRCEEPPRSSSGEGPCTQAPSPPHGGGLLGRLGLGGGSTDWMVLLLVLLLCSEERGKGKGEEEDLSLLLLLLLLFLN